MKIEVNIDIEALVRKEIRNYVRENLIIHNVVGDNTIVEVGTIEAEPQDTVSITLDSTPTKIKEEAVVMELMKEEEKTKPDVTNSFEYGPKPGRRRTKIEMALHELELEKGRTLTPEEKGEIQGTIEHNEEEEIKAKEATKKKLRIKKITDEVMEETKQELDEESPNPKEQVESIIDNLFESKTPEKKKPDQEESPNDITSLFS